VTRDPRALRSAIDQLASLGVRTSLFIDPDLDTVARSRDLGAVAIEQLGAEGIRTSLFIDPDTDAVTRSRVLGAVAVELHTGRYAHHPNDAAVLRALEEAARHGKAIGLAVHAGHGLTTRNVGPVAAIPEIEELNIGHSIVSRAVFVGIAEAVREMRAVMDVARTRG
jgi:pyridoxine 5-phosphate synthase